MLNFAARQTTFCDYTPSHLKTEFYGLTQGCCAIQLCA